MSEYSGYNLISIPLHTILNSIKCEFIGSENTIITGFGLSNRPLLGDSYITYCTAEKFLKRALLHNKISVIVVSPKLIKSLGNDIPNDKSFIIVDNPEAAFYEIFINTEFPRCKGIQDTVNASIGYNTIIEDGVEIGRNVSIGHNSVIKYGTLLGDDVVIGSNVVIGGDGFQMIKDKKGRYITIPHRGGVKIGSNVFIGDGTTIAKSLFDGYTEIGNDTKISNQVAISHNCVIGQNCAIAANATLFGSCVIGNDVWVAPASSILNRVKVGDSAFICAHSFVSKDVDSGDKVFGVPAESRYKKGK